MKLDAAGSVRRAFTTIELIVVMIVLAILASIAVVSLAPTIDRYELRRAVETIEIFDARARRYARTDHHTLHARINRTRGRLTIASAGTSDATSSRLPRRVRIKEIVMQQRADAGGDLEIDINPSGQSSSYAVHLQRGRSNLWVVVLGLSGQVITLNTKGEVDAILSW